jgi:hypothetical protein
MNRHFIHWAIIRGVTAQPFCGLGQKSLVTWNRSLITCPRCKS